MLDWLQTFVVAAETENFRQTAELLHLAQPTVTLHIQKLEQQLGMSLFERVGRQVRLSPAGRQFLPHALAVVRHWRDGRAQLHRWRAGYDTTVVVGTSPLIATTYLPRWIQQASRRNPRIQFSIRVRESADLLSDVLSGACDIAFTRLPVAHAQVQCLPLYDDPLLFIVPADGADLDGPAQSPEDWLADHPVLTHNHPGYWDALVPALQRFYPDVRTLPVSQVHVTIHWIVERMGVSFLPASTVQRELLRGTVAEVPFSAFALPKVATYLLLRTGALSPAVSAFAEEVQAYMRIRKFETGLSANRGE
ncbi:HTH-type transcriptional regulator CitR [Alicyclobacillus contaminans]|uniref:LysR family transcriptional regulator n=1 Tax=Alicyclobacillus contaminans TaxID=392016 RepID=UPI00040A4216|nr:LysR family transcriptional regulator [Alicyclobacillus contaminans]GMA50581.1 HTH-type transcriptional regulator CitR [Alicyclobacillus contaminans]